MLLRPRTEQSNEFESDHALLRELEALSLDYKASVIAAELADNGVPPDVFYFRNQSTFKRSISRDVAHIFWHDNDEKGDPDNLIFDLNREGIYDMLPEAIVHTQAHKPSGDDADQKLGLELRRQERDARKFFSPLENEFHHRSLKLDMVERQLLKNNNPKRNREFFNYFFEDSSALDDQQLLVLLHILPLSHKIRGDISLIGLTLSRILGYQVNVSQSWTLKSYSLPSQTSSSLGAGTLGANTVLNTSYSMPSVQFDVSIFDVPATAFRDFSPGGSYMNVLSFILPYFFPVNSDYSTVLYPKKEQATMVLSDGDSRSFLGFNSYI